MKTNTMKYIFFTIVVIMIGLAIYFLYRDGKQKVYAVETENMKIDMVRELNIGISGYDTINPINSKNRDIQFIDKLIFEPLIEVGNDFKVQNCIAKEFSKINDLTYIIKLNDDKYFHNGEKLTSKDVVFTLNNLKNKKIDSIYKENVKDIQDIQIIDDYTIKIILNNNVDFFEYMMCIPILAEHFYDENTLNATSNNPIGTGKFKIEEINEDRIVLTKSNMQNESKITKINIVLKDSVIDLYNAFAKGEIDYMITDNAEFEGYVGSLGYNVNYLCYREFDYLVLNNENGILRNKEIRKAINYAIDKNNINYEIYNNKYKISEFPLDYGNYLYDSIGKTDYNIALSENIFLENGWILQNDNLKKNGRNLRLRILVNKEYENRVKVAENIKEQLRKIGIKVDIYAVNTIQFNTYTKSKNYDMILTGNIVSNSPNIETYLGEKNLSNFKNDEVINIINEIKSIDNQEETLKERYKRLEEIYIDEMPFISLYFNNLYILSNKNLKGDLNGNWYNIYYNIDNWYKIK